MLEIHDDLIFSGTLYISMLKDTNCVLRACQLKSVCGDDKDVKVE